MSRAIEANLAEKVAALRNKAINEEIRIGARSIIGHYPYAPTEDDKAQQEEHMKRALRHDALEMASRLYPADSAALIDAAKAITAYIEGGA